MLLTISVTVIAAIMLVAVVVLIQVALQVRRTAREAEKFLETARTQIAPLAHDFTVISGEVKSILQSIDRQVENVEEGVANVKNAVMRLRAFQLEVQQRIEEPILQFVALVGAVNHGVRTFLQILRR